MVTPVLHHDIPWRITHPSFCLILTVTFCSFKKLKTTYIIHPLLHQHLLRTYYMQGTWLDATGMGMYKTSLVAQTAKHLPTMQETWVQSLGGEDPQEKEMQPTPVFLPGKFHGQRSLLGYSHGVAKSQTQLSNFIFFLSGYMLRSGFARLYNSVFNLSRTLDTAFHSGWTNLHYYQQCSKVPFSPTPSQFS